MNRFIIVCFGAVACASVIGCETITNVVSVPVREQAIVSNTQDADTVVPEPAMEPKPVVAGRIDPQVVYFSSNSSVLAESAQSILRSLSNVILQNMESVQAIDVTGHVAFAGTEEGREQISSDRSKRVAEYLVELGIPQSLVNAMSRDADQPVATNKTAEGRALNRRANIIIIQK